MEPILSNAQVQYGALGLLIIMLSGGLGAVWKLYVNQGKQHKAELDKIRQSFTDERKAWNAERQKYHQELLGLNDRLISSQKEFQLLLKSLTDKITIEDLFKEYSKRD